MSNEDQYGSLDPLEIAADIITIGSCHVEYENIDKCAISNNIAPEDIEILQQKCKRQLESFKECAEKLPTEEVIGHIVTQEGCEDERTKFERCFTAQGAEAECQPLFEKLLDCGARKFLERLENEVRNEKKYDE